MFGIHLMMIALMHETRAEGPRLLNFTTQSMADVRDYLKMNWFQCLRDPQKIPLPSIKVYNEDGSVMRTTLCLIWVMLKLVIQITLSLFSSLMIVHIICWLLHLEINFFTEITSLIFMNSTDVAISCIKQ